MDAGKWRSGNKLLRARSRESFLSVCTRCDIKTGTIHPGHVSPMHSRRKLIALVAGGQLSGCADGQMCAPDCRFNCFRWPATKHVTDRQRLEQRGYRVQTTVDGSIRDCSIPILVMSWFFTVIQSFGSIVISIHSFIHSFIHSSK